MDKPSIRQSLGRLVVCLALLDAASSPARADTVIEPQGDYELNTNVVIEGAIGETIKAPSNGDTSLVSFAALSMTSFPRPATICSQRSTPGTAAKRPGRPYTPAR